MPLQLRLGGSWITPTGLKIFSAGSWRTIQAIKIYAGGAWRDVANFTPAGGGGGGGGTLVVSRSPASLTKNGTAGFMTTANVTATPSGGLAPYSYAWSIITDDGNAPYVINTPTLATTSVTGGNLVLNLPLGISTLTIRCAVTDSLGVSANSSNVTVTFNRAA